MLSKQWICCGLVWTVLSGEKKLLCFTLKKQVLHLSDTQPPHL